MEMIYKPVKGSILNNEQAMRYGSRLNELAQSKGLVRATDIVEDAADDQSPLHDFFEWDDTVAAGKWREDQAYYLLRNIAVVTEQPDGQEKEIRLMYNIVDTDNTRGYVNIVRILDEQELRQQIIDKALRELRSWRDKYKTYKELVPILEAIEPLPIFRGL